MEIHNGIFLLAAMSLHRKFNPLQLCELTSLSRTTVWRWMPTIPKAFPGTAIKALGAGEFELESISPLFNEAGLQQYYDLCLAQLNIETHADEAFSVESIIEATSAGGDISQQKACLTETLDPEAQKQDAGLIAGKAEAQTTLVPRFRF